MLIVIYSYKIAGYAAVLSIFIISLPTIVAFFLEVIVYRKETENAMHFMISRNSSLK
jgi:hypothetical protein